jgi:hypothetical protein
MKILMKRLRVLLIMSSVAALFVVLAGCGNKDDGGVNATQMKALDRTQQIVQQSGGDWNKVSAADQQYLIQGPGYGNEQTARDFLISSYNHMKSGPHAPAGNKGPGAQNGAPVNPGN